MAFELTILGSSSALPTSERYPTAQVLNASGRFFLIDCGEGTQIQIRRQKIAFGKIRHIFISHLHGDHYYGLIGLISTFNLLGLKNDLHIYAPSQLKDILEPQLNFLKAGLQFAVVFHPLNFKKPQLIFEDKVIEVLSFPLKHSIKCCGFLFREKQKERNIKKESILEFNIPIAQIRAIKQGADFELESGAIIPNEKLTTPPPSPVSYAFCSDTSFYPAVVETIRGVSALYHEATFTEELRELADKTHHSTALDAAEIAKLANAGQLIIGHFSSRYKTTDAFLKEAQSVFENTKVAIDGKTYSIKN
jgi:ribonuclease Z